MFLYISILAAFCSLSVGQKIRSSMSSCEEILMFHPCVSSGEYNITNGNGNLQQVYCEMDTLCGGRGWTRLGRLDMTESGRECPSEFRLYETGGVRACGRKPTDSGKCNSLTISSFGINYTEVCARVIGYQVSSPNAFHVPDGFVDDIDIQYIDGVSITHGTPRQHIWTLGASRYDTYNADNSRICPCAQGSSQKTQSFVGEDYYCESGCTNNLSSGCGANTGLYADDRLWDGENCGPAEVGCCSSTQPWFHKVLDGGTTDGIELRICSNSGTDVEDTAVELYEIFVK